MLALKNAIQTAANGMDTHALRFAPRRSQTKPPALLPAKTKKVIANA